RRARAQWFSVKSELERELAADELKRSLHDAKQAAADLQQTMQETEAEVQAKVRAAEDEARREIESLRRQASLADADATTGTEATAAAQLAAAETPQPDAPQPDTQPPPSGETPHQPGLLAGGRDDTDTDDGHQR